MILSTRQRHNNTVTEKNLWLTYLLSLTKYRKLPLDMDLQRFTTTQKIADMNTKTKTCLQCDNQIHQRGLCSTCYGRFTRSKQRLPEEKQKAFEEALIATGKLLPPAKRPPSSRDEYAELADRLQDATPQEVQQILEEFQKVENKSQKPSVQQEAADVVEKAKRRATRKGITPRDKKQP